MQYSISFDIEATIEALRKGKDGILTPLSEREPPPTKSLMCVPQSIPLTPLKRFTINFENLRRPKGGFANENSLLKLLYTGMPKTAGQWPHPVQNWNLALPQLAIHFDGRLDRVLNTLACLENE